METGDEFPAGLDLTDDGFDPLSWYIQTSNGAIFRYLRLLLTKHEHVGENLFLYTADEDKIVVKYTMFDCAHDMELLAEAADIKDGGLAVVPCKFLEKGRLQLMPLLDGDVTTLMTTLPAIPPLVDFLRFFVLQMKRSLKQDLIYSDYKLENLLWRFAPRIDNKYTDIEIMFGDLESFINIRPDAVFFTTYPYRKMAAQTRTEMYENLLYGICFIALAYYAHSKSSLGYRVCSYDRMVWRNDKPQSLGFMYKRHAYYDMVTSDFTGRPPIVKDIEHYLNKQIIAMYNQSLEKKRSICERALDVVLSSYILGSYVDPV